MDTVLRAHVSLPHRAGRGDNVCAERSAFPKRRSDTLSSLGRGIEIEAEVVSSRLEVLAEGVLQLHAL